MNRKGGGGRNAVTQDLIRDNLEELDMDPFLPSATDDVSSSELYPQIPPPLSAALMSAEAAHCVLKRASITRRFKLSAYFLSKQDRLAGSVRRYNEPAALDRNVSIKQMVHTTMKSCLYFPEEILEGFGVNRVKSANTDSSRKRRVVDNLHRPRSGSTGNDLVFGRLEKRERLTGSTEAEGDGEGGDTLVGPKVEGGDAERVEAARQRAAERGGEYGGSGDDEEQEDEYELDDDYGQAHGMSDDDGGGDDDDGDEAVF